MARTTKAKRTASAPPAEEPGAKKVAAMLLEEGISKTALDCVEEVLKHPVAEISGDCQKMLLGALPWAVCTASDVRHTSQATVVRMVGEVAASVEARLGEAIEVEATKLTEVEARNAELERAVTEAQAQERKATEAEQSMEVQLKELAANLSEKTLLLSERQAEEKTGNAEIDKLRAERGELEAVLTESLQRLKNGAFDDSEGESLSKAVEAIAPKLSLEESLLTTFPSTLRKRERTQFDNIVMDQFEENLRAKSGSIGTSIEALEGPAKERTDARSKAQAEVEVATAAHEEAVAGFSQAKEVKAKAIYDLRRAKADLAGFEPSVQKATAARNMKQAELEVFREYNVAAFETLRDRIQKQNPEPEAAAAGA